jgi:hypothetical protein
MLNYPNKVIVLKKIDLTCIWTTGTFTFQLTTTVKPVLRGHLWDKEKVAL